MPQILRGRRYGAPNRTSARARKTSGADASTFSTTAPKRSSAMMAMTSFGAPGNTSEIRATPRSGWTTAACSVPSSTIVAKCTFPPSVGVRLSDGGSEGTDHATVAADLLSGDIRRLCAGEKRDSGGELLGPAISSCWDRRLRCAPDLLQGLA